MTDLEALADKRLQMNYQIGRVLEARETYHTALHYSGLTADLYGLKRKLKAEEAALIAMTMCYFGYADPDEE